MLLVFSTLSFPHIVISSVSWVILFKSIRSFNFSILKKLTQRHHKFVLCLKTRCLQWTCPSLRASPLTPLLPALHPDPSSQPQSLLPVRYILSDLLICLCFHLYSDVQGNGDCFPFWVLPGGIQSLTLTPITRFYSRHSKFTRNTNQKHFVFIIRPVTPLKYILFIFMLFC